MRRHYIDNLRWIFILLLIPYHAAQAWNTWGEPNYIFFESNQMISSIVVFFSPFFMPMLFALAGISARYSLQKRTVSQYFLERARKLLMPFIFGTLFIMPVMCCLADRHNYGYKGTFLLHYRIFFTRFTDLTGADGGFSVGQFWFLLYLFVISCVSAGIILLQKKIRFQTACKTMPFFLIFLLGLPLPLLHNLLAIGGKSLAAYMYLFLIGFSVFADERFTDRLADYKWYFLCIGLSASILNVYLFLWSDCHYPGITMAAGYVSEWFMLAAILGIGKTYLDFHGKRSAYMAKRSFLFYILHFIFVVFFQYLMSNMFAQDTFFLYIVPVIFAYAATFAGCEICIRIPLLCFLMGNSP